MNRLVAALVGLGVASALSGGSVAQAATVTMGLAAKYPGDAGIKSDASVVMVSDFENDGWAKDWSYHYGNATTVTSDAARQFEPLQGRALRVSIPRGSNYGIDSGYKFAQKIGSEPEEIYFRYYLRFASNWNPSWDGKLPGTAGRYNAGGWGGNVSTGSNGWSARGIFEVPNRDGAVPIGNYVYHVGMSQWGDHFLWQNEGLGNLQKNRWYCIEQYLKLNTPGSNNGVMRGWVDGKLAFEKSGLRFRDVSRLKIEEVWFNVYHGGDATPPADIDLYMDNMVVARQYIGPMAAADAAAAPAAPTLSVK